MPCASVMQLAEAVVSELLCVEDSGLATGFKVCTNLVTASIPATAKASQQETDSNCTAWQWVRYD